MILFIQILFALFVGYFAGLCVYEDSLKNEAF